MKAIPFPPNEAERLGLLKRLEMLDTGPEEIFADIARAIALICDAPVALISLGDEYRPWFKPKAGMEADEKPSDAPFYTHAIMQDKILIIPDVLKDERFTDVPLLTGEPKIRFYAGTPLKLAPTIKLGILSVIDYRPRKLDAKQLALLELLADHVVSLIRLRLDKLETSMDFSALVTVKQKLQFQKDLMEAIFDNEPESVTILSTQGELEQINRAGLDMLEVDSLAEARSQQLTGYVLPEFRDIFGKLEDKALHGEHAIAEYKIRGMKGTERWIESHAAPLYDQQGKIVNLIAVTRDITRLKQSQDQLMLAARVFSEAQEGILITDARGTIVDVNPAFCSITGFGREEIIGQNPRILHSGKQSPDFYAAMWKTLGETGHWKGEIWNRRKNGELYAELISINALRDEAGNAINYVGLFLDITAVKQQQANK
jgi:PAS domain S-box-containing protein